MLLFFFACQKGMFLDNPDGTERQFPPRKNTGAVKYGQMIFRWGLLIAVIVGIHFTVSSILTVYITPLTSEEAMLSGVMMISLLLLYVVLLAIPFVPGVEIGISLLIMHGSEAAPFVYGATLSGLLLSYALGIAFSDKLPCWFLETLGFHRACVFIEKMKVLSPADRLKILESSLPGWVGHWVLKKRYLLLAVLLNLPGNSLIGGGGGIAMISGLSRLFSVRWVIVTLALATAPIPALVYIFGSDLIR